WPPQGRPPLLCRPMTWWSRSQATSSLGGVDDLDATVLGPAAVGMLAADRTLFTVADHVDLAGRGTVGFQRALHRLGTALAEAQVVFARTALVGIAFQAHVGAGAVLQILGVAGHDLLELGLDL